MLYQMISREELGNYLHTYLACDNFNDYAPNGIQVEGKSDIHRICVAVTASAKVIKKAVALQADALITHHGYFWRGEDPIIVGMKRERIGQLITHNVNLFAYHLPLDCHPIIGNNACLANLLGVNEVKMHMASKTQNLLWSGVLNQTVTAADLSELLTKKLKRVPLHIKGKDQPISSIAWCSGAAQDFIEDAHRLGVDAYLSGEISERTYYQAQELGIHYFSCGHHATERYGIQALGLHISERFGTEYDFIDSDNPV